jgi:hypothetical protein
VIFLKLKDSKPDLARKYAKNVSSPKFMLEESMLEVNFSL